MMLMLALLLQGGTVTVGDTVWIERALVGTEGAVVRPQPWLLGALGQQLGPADVRLVAGGSVVRYALVLWYPGEHLLTMPGPVLVRRDGRSDTLGVSTARVQVTSVLPANERRATLAPRPAITSVPLVATSPLPLVVLLLIAAVVLLPAAVLWRRRGAAAEPQPPRGSSGPPSIAILRRWGSAGEHRAALDGWGWVLARRLAESRDLAETAELQRVLDDIADSVYSPRGPEHFARLCERAERLEAA
jgi:hypothetical protein